MPSTTHRGSSREKLIDAAANLITQHSVQELTLDGVAAAASVTKGGLIYHFKTKDDLLGAVVERLIEQIGQRNQARATKHGDTTTALLLALVDDTFDLRTGEKQLMSNLLAAASAYPHLLGPVRALFSRVYGDLANANAGADVGLALVLAAALDGITLLELLGFHQFSEQQHQAMRKALNDLIKKLK